MLSGGTMSNGRPEMPVEAVTLFMHTGYLCVHDAIPRSLLVELKAQVDALFAAPSEPYRVNGEGEICRIEGLLARHPVFADALRSDRLLAVLTQLLGPDIEVALHRHNHATLNRRGDVPFRLHRDVQQWSRPLLDVFIYLEDADVENGCTHIVPGSHLLPYAGSQSGGGAGNWADEHKEYRHLIGQELPVPMKEGDVLLVHASTFHSVGVNRTSRSRRSLVFACHSSDDLNSRSLVDRELLVGRRTFRGNPALQVSGSLASVTPRSER